MERQNIVAGLKRCNGGAEVITKRQLASFFGIKKTEYVNKYVHKLEAIEGKYFLVTEVAGELIQRTK